ncbi:MAG TPA: hypothetical protein PLZ45_04020 [Ferruginibacter sp.]|nr:hypothetical protein [Ferruginibacter sp.]
MIPGLPMYLNILFIGTTLLSVFIFYKAASRSNTTLLLLFAWLGIQATVAYTGFYKITTGFPPRFALLAAPALLFIILLFVTGKGKKYLDGLDAKTLTLLHVVRIPVELCLYGLFLNKAVPEVMTFAGRNFDILAGITAPVIYYSGYVTNRIGKTGLVAWNIACLCLLFNIVITAVLSAPTSFQQFGFDQPNTAILYFPFVWLPCCVVPLVLLAHLACLRKLLIK